MSKTTPNRAGPADQNSDEQSNTGGPDNTGADAPASSGTAIAPAGGGEQVNLNERLAGLRERRAAAGAAGQSGGPGAGRRAGRGMGQGGGGGGGGGMGQGGGRRMGQGGGGGGGMGQGGGRRMGQGGGGGGGMGQGGRGGMGQGGGGMGQGGRRMGQGGGGGMGPGGGRRGMGQGFDATRPAGSIGGRVKQPAAPWKAGDGPRPAGGRPGAGMAQAAGPSQAGQDDPIAAGRKILDQLSNRMGESADGNQKPMQRMLQNVARGYEALEKEVERLRSELEKPRQGE